MFRSLSPVKSLGSKLILFFLIGSVGPMIVLTLINNSISSKNMLDVARGRVEARVDASIDRIEAYLAERRSDAEVVAALPGINNALEQPDNDDMVQAARNILIQVREAYGYSSVSVIDENGDVLLSSFDALEDKNFVGRPEIQDALRGITSISEIGAKPSEEEVFFHVTAAVYDDTGEIVGVIDLRNSLDELNRIMEFDTDRTGQGSYGLLLDEHLIRIVYPDHPELLYQPVVPLASSTLQQLIERGRFGRETGTRLREASDLTKIEETVRKIDSGEVEQEFVSVEAQSTGEKTETLIKKLESKDWYYVHAVPQSSFYAAVNAQTNYALMVMVGAAIIAVTAMVVFSRQTLSRPLHHLVDVAKAIAEGDLGKRLTINRQDEIGELATSFNTMADALETRIQAQQQAQAEAVQMQEIERSTRQELEHAVTDYLAFTDRIAKGDLSQRLTVRHNGSLGSLGNGLNAMVESLHGITRQVQQATSDIASSAAEILAATSQQASSAAEQSSAVTQISTTLEEIKTITYKTAKQAEQIAHDSKEAIKIAGRGTQSVEDTIAGMQQIRGRVESIAQTILSLSEQTQAIGAITTTVSELADQSNMLALNAAIEAARAGEQGKSFAIVAQHVRELAERSKGATGQVREILEEIQRATNAAVMVTEEGTKGVEVGVKQATSAGQVIHEIATEVENESQASVQMATAAQQQTAGIEQIGQAMIAIQQSSTQTLTSTRQAEQAAKDLNSLAQSLQNAIAAYHL